MQVQFRGVVDELYEEHGKVSIGVKSLRMRFPLSQQDVPRVSIGDVVVVEANVSGDLTDPASRCTDEAVRLLGVSEQGNAAFQK